MKNFVYVTLFAAAFGCAASCGCQASKADEGNTGSDAGFAAERVETKVKRPVMQVDTSYNGLKVYWPDFSSVDLVCGTMPMPDKDSNVIFCCEAAFTGVLLDEFQHSNIAGDHVSGGVFHKGYRCRANTGIFVYYNGVWKFLMGNDTAELRVAADNGGMGFGQNMVIFDGKVQPFFRKPGSRFEYRTLCELNDRLCVIDSRDVVRYDDYVSLLKAAGVTYALYLDMGSGWNCSWYRNSASEPAEWIHQYRHKYTTNWLVFKE